MLIGKIHPGSGLGDQLFSYIVTRVIALDKGYDFGFVGKEFFKGEDFMNLDWGEEGANYNDYHIEEPAGKLVITPDHKLFEINKPYYDPEVNFIADGTVVDGYGAQDIRYFEHRLDEVNRWLAVKPLPSPENLCVINFRGGEFSRVPELFLPKEYWQEAIQMMRDKYLDIVFEVHTDDVELAETFFPGMFIQRNIGVNWRAVRCAKHLIISNSAFAILPALLNEDVKEVIAPRYWARRNTKEWSLPSNYYPKFQYI